MPTGSWPWMVLYSQSGLNSFPPRHLLFPVPSLSQKHHLWLQLLTLCTGVPSLLLRHIFGTHSPLIGLGLLSFPYLYCYFLSLILQELGICVRHFLSLNCLSLFLCPSDSHRSPAQCHFLDSLVTPYAGCPPCLPSQASCDSLFSGSWTQAAQAATASAPHACGESPKVQGVS